MHRILAALVGLCCLALPAFAGSDKSQGLDQASQLVTALKALVPPGQTDQQLWTVLVSPGDPQMRVASGLVLADRYTTSNAVHQSSKVPPEERPAFFQWLFDFEYGRLGLPEPDLVLYLDMPTELSEQMMRHREQVTHTKADIHERNEAYLRACRESAAMVVEYGGWTRIDCARDGAPRTVEDIHREVMEKLRDLLVDIK